MNFIDGKTVLLTGGTGSFGKRFVKYITEKHKPKKLIIYSRDELKQFEMQQWANAPFLQYVLGDVRDYQRTVRAMDGVDTVVHAAAMKQVPASEYNPIEAIKTNIIGAENIVNACIEQKVSRVVALSTDKAANPANLYGATKLCSDKLFVAANHLAEKSGTKFCVVRYGNVIGSRGSVIPFFMKKKSEGVLPITDPRMTRFMITLTEGVKFVLDSLQRMKGGEIFVPKIPTMKITDVAKAVAPECRHEIIGIRPGEKMHELMIAADDARNTLEFGSYYVIQPAAFWWNQKEFQKESGGNPVRDEFEYSSGTNTQLMSATDLQNVLEREPVEI